MRTGLRFVRRTKKENTRQRSNPGRFCEDVLSFCDDNAAVSLAWSLAAISHLKGLQPVDGNITDTQEHSALMKLILSKKDSQESMRFNLGRPCVLT